MTQIHPFTNGNGRHARMMADLLIERLGRKPFSWGGGSAQETGDANLEARIQTGFPEGGVMAEPNSTGDALQPPAISI